MKLCELLERVGMPVPASHARREITSVVCDSRRVRPGALFVALRGCTHDGTAFVDDASRRGAVAVVSENPVTVRGETIALAVADAHKSYGLLSAALHDYPSRALRVAGVTGTNGKTTVAFMMRDILRRARLHPGMIGTVQYEIGSRIIPALRTTPDAGELQTLLGRMVQAECRSAMIEVSSHAVEQKRVWAVDFDVGIFTNLTRDHLDYHGDMENYYQAKRAFFLRLGWGVKPGIAVLNIDDPAGRRLAADSEIRAEIVTCGSAPDAAVRAVEVVADESGGRIKVISPWGVHRLNVKLLGRHNVSNALAAFAAAGALGINPDEIADSLRNLKTVPGRLEEIKGGQGFRVFVDYAHTDDALENVLQALRPLTRGRLIVVFGCGGNRDRSKRAAMGAVAARAADMAVVTTDNPRKENPEVIIRDIVSGFPGRQSPRVAVDRREAIRAAISAAASGDVVLIAGKGHETFQEFEHTVIPFDDREEARIFMRSRITGQKGDQ